MQLGTVLLQRCTEWGVWQETRLAAPEELPDEERGAIERSATGTAAALRAAGYFGPFGVDAFRFVDGAGVLRLQPRVEVNARYGMGWALGMAERRRQ